jgi:hypothetical protein
LLARLGERARALRAKGYVRVPFLPFDDTIATSLKSAHTAGRVVRGLEETERVLDAEARGMGMVDRKSGVERGARVSRVLIVAADGGESFYKQVERLLERHGARVLVIRVDADAAALGAPLFGPDRTTRLLMVSHKDAVAALLIALAESLEAPR